MQAEIICKNCGHRFAGKYCNECGEKVYTEHDKTFAHFMEEGIHFITHFDSKLLRTWWQVMVRPGLVSNNISAGARKRYYKPVNLFIIGVILYLLFPFFPGLNMPMKMHVEQIHGTIAKGMIREKMESRNLSYDEVARKFDDKSPKFAKVLLLVVIPLSGFALQGLFRNKRRYYFDHITLASELNTFYLYLIFFVLPFIFTIFFLVAEIFISNPSLDIDDSISMPMYFLVLGYYCYTAFRRFYKEKIGWAIVKSVLFLIVHGLIVYVIYRFILFCVVLLFI